MLTVKTGTMGQRVRRAILAKPTWTGGGRVSRLESEKPFSVEKNTYYIQTAKQLSEKCLPKKIYIIPIAKSMSSCLNICTFFQTEIHH